MQDAEYNIITLFSDGGGMMYILLLASLFGLGVVIAKGYVLWVAQRDSRRLLEDGEALAREGRLDEAIQRAEETPGPVSAILVAGLRGLRGNARGDDVEQSMTATGTIELGFLERGLIALATIATVAPLLGFLGTVWGMIEAFGAIELAGQVEATLVASGIKIALLTTATGLLIAIPVNVAYNFFVTRIDKLIIDMEEGSTAILNIFWDREPAAAMANAGGAAQVRDRSHAGDYSGGPTRPSGRGMTEGTEPPTTD